MVVRLLPLRTALQGTRGKATNKLSRQVSKDTVDLAIAANDNETLIDQLSFQPPPIATYARERRLVQIQPQGANSFSPQGNQVMTFSLSSQEGWLDPSQAALPY